MPIAEIYEITTTRTFERDAIMALMWSGKFSSIEIAMLIPDAMQLAQQEAVVAREMGAP
jgi:hypothetical protein